MVNLFSDEARWLFRCRRSDGFPFLYRVSDVQHLEVYCLCDRRQSLAVEMAALSSQDQLDLKPSRSELTMAPVNESRQGSVRYSDNSSFDTVNSGRGNSFDKDDMRVRAVTKRLASASADLHHAQRMGKRQQLRRKFEMVSTVGFTSFVVGFEAHHFEINALMS